MGKHSLLTRSLRTNRFPVGGCAFYRSPDGASVLPMHRLHVAMRRSSCRRTAYPCVLESTYATLLSHYDLRIRSVLLSLLRRFSPFRHFPRHSFLLLLSLSLSSLCISSPAVRGLEAVLTADLLQFVQYTRENLSYLADLLKFVQYTIVHLSTFLSGADQPIEHLISPGKKPEDIPRKKWDVQKEA